jgi:hypothetical protein
VTFPDSAVTPVLVSQRERMFEVGVDTPLRHDQVACGPHARSYVRAGTAPFAT